MRLYNYIKFQFKNSFYVRMFSIFSLTLIIFLTSIISIFMSQQNKIFTETKLERYQHSLDQFKIYSDSYVLNRVYSLIVKDLMYSYSTQDLLFKDDSYKNVPNDFSDSLHIRQTLYNAHATIDFVHSISVYNKTHDTFIDSMSGAFYNVSTQKDIYEKMIPYDILESSLSNPTSQTWVPYDMTRAFYPNKYITTFSQHAPMFLAPEDTTTVFFINIDLQRAYEEYISSTNTQKESFKILNTNGELLFDTNLKEDLLPVEALPMDEILSKSSDIIYTLYNDMNMYTVFEKSSANNWIYLYTIVDDSSIFTTFYPFTQLALGILMIVLLCFMLTFFLTRWLYKPLHHLVDSSKSYLGLSSAEGDLSTIHSAFSTLDHKVENLQSLVEKNDTLIFNKTLTDVINGKIEDIELLNERLQIFNKQFEFKSFYFVILKIDQNYFENLSSNDKEMLHITGLSIIGDFFTSASDTTLTYLTQFNYSGYFTCLINASEEKYNEEIKNLDKLLNIISTKLNIHLNISISNLFSDLIVAPTHHKEAMDYFKYTYIHDNQNIFTPSLISDYEKENLDLIQDVLVPLETLLNANKFNELKEQLDLLFKLIKSSGYSYLYTYNLFIQFISIIDRQCKLKNLSTPSLNHAKLLEDFSEIHSLNLLKPWFYEIIGIVESAIISRNESLHSTLIHEIKDYIINNIDDQLSLNSVALHFSISTGHLSRMFKENTGSNFSDFVSNAKFEKATTLLIEQPNLKISDISLQLGYSNVAYFTKIFKERYSMTPTQYRKLNK